MRATLLVRRRSIACHRGWHAVLCRRVCTQGRGTNLAHAPHSVLAKASSSCSSELSFIAPLRS